MRRAITLFAVASLAALVACGEDSDPLQAWPKLQGDGPDQILGIAEVSDMLPRVQRQIGPGGPVQSFLPNPDDGIVARARVVEVAPWYSVVGEMVEDGETISDTGRRTVVGYGTEGAFWSMTKVTIEIVDDYGEVADTADRMTVEARGLVEDLEPFVDADVIVTVARGLPFHPTNGEVIGLEWSLGWLSPVNDDGTITWPEEAPVGRSTTIEAFEAIAERGEIVVTTDAIHPIVVLDRREP